MSAKRSKRYRESLKTVDTSKVFEFVDAVAAIQAAPTTKFDQSVELVVSLKVKKNESVRETVVLPHSFGDKKRIIVFAKGEKIEEAEAAGAIAVGLQEIIDKIKVGWLDFDVAISTPECMKEVATLGPILGRKGLMPNPKSGTVTMNIAPTIKEIQAGRCEFRSDKDGSIQVVVGKNSMNKELIAENCRTVLEAIKNALPSSIKISSIKAVKISLSMGPSVHLNYLPFFTS